ncbi:MAG: ethylbenzene dehydrogenase-related protein [Proteobacteria bacterium]|nr:ethylbenzene dehydrogenase-related protein [Pseudomonadota bacterium]
MIRRIALLTSVVVVIVAAFAETASATDIVTAIKVKKPPVLTAGPTDPVWAKAKALTVSLTGGANFKDGKTSAAIKAVYVGDMFYMLVEYDDPTQSVRRVPYQKQTDGIWKKLRDPNDKGGDENLYYEDKLALIWNVANSIRNFNQLGCMTSCHAGEPGKPYGNKYTMSAGELGDIWHMKSVRTGPVGQVDDQYLDNTRFDKEIAPGAGRKSDPKTGGGYTNIELVNGKPEFMDRRGTASNKKSGTYYLKEDSKLSFDDGKFEPGDEVASITIAPFAGDRGDVAASMNWKNGKWTVVMSRKLVTGGKYDVQFEKLDATYEFGLAAFDNAQVRHAFHVGSLKLQFRN